MGNTILCVDEDPAILEALRWVFDDEPFELIQANRVSQAIDYVDQKYFDLILLDLIIPAVMGTELVEYLTLRTDAPVIVLSAVQQRYYVDKAMKAGASGYVFKPFDVDDLIQKVYAVLRGETLPEPPLQTLPGKISAFGVKSIKRTAGVGAFPGKLSLHGI